MRCEVDHLRLAALIQRLRAVLKNSPLLIFCSLSKEHDYSIFFSQLLVALSTDYALTCTSIQPFYDLNTFLSCLVMGNF